MKTKSFIIIVSLLLILFLEGCNLNSSNTNSSIYEGHKNYARFELPQSKDECNSTSDCVVGGCSFEICTAGEPQPSNCEVPQGMEKGISCECVNKQCIWVKK